MTISKPYSLPAQPDLLADRYRIEQPLGEGGMASIYRVLDTVTGTQLALKQLTLGPTESGSQARITLFQREYHALKQLAHPRIIKVHDYGVADGRPYYTMELLDGKDARELAPLEWNQACVVLRDVASSLAIVHSRRLVYRDVSPRNVRCTTDGRAKLLDFGALTPIGVPSHVVGTPAFMPPEALYGQPLDQRSDLYGLGALAYWLLSGTMPYRVRQLSELRDAWRTRPVPIAQLIPSIPVPLSALVMSLLSHNPTARPQSAGEVIDKLSAIAQLTPDPDLGVVRAYLTTPELVGRDLEVLRMRKALVRATRGRGSAWLVRALPGGGRTRMLDVCTLEGKLAGAWVARVQAHEVGGGAFAALHHAVEQWAEAAPSALARTLRACLPPSDIKRSSHADIAAALLKIAAQRSLLLTVDDAQRIDPDSLAVFAVLARSSETHKLVVCASSPRGGFEESLPLRMLADAMQPVDLAPWSLPQTQSLLQSLFGAVAGVPLVAARIQSVAQGNPRDTMQLAQHLIDVGVVSHKAGAWSLPAQLAEIALPRDMQQAQQLAIAELDEDSRTLAACLALEPELDAIALSDCALLSPNAPLAIDTLLRQDIVVECGEGVSFRHRALAQALVEALDAETRRALHVRMAALHEGAGRHVLTIAYHLHHAGQASACISLIRAWLAQGAAEKLTPPRAALLDVIVLDTEHDALSIKERHRLRCVLLQHGSVFEPEYGRHGEATFEQLRKDTGLEYWQEHSELEPSARIGRCLERALAEHTATPEAERGLHPLEALRDLAVLVRWLTSIYARTLAAEKLIGLAGWLEPFRTIVPIIDLLYELTTVSADRAVREKRVAHRYLEFAERFAQPLAGLDDHARGQAIALCTYCAALDEAKQGKHSAIERVAPLEQIEGFAALAWHVRMLSHIYQGRTAEAARCRERMELLSIDQDRPFTLLAMSVLYEAWGYEMCEDLTGLKRALEQVEHEAQRFPGWHPWAILYFGDVERLRGDVQSALACYERVANATAPGKHQVWPHAAERRVGALRQLGRLVESIALGRSLVTFGEREDLEPVNLLRFYIAVALSEAQAGELDAARHNIDAALRCAQREGVEGVPLGIVHEAEARLAIRAKDPKAFERASQHCARYLLAGDNPALMAKYDRLMLEARAAGFDQHIAQRSLPDGAVSRTEALRVQLSALPEPERMEQILRTLISSCGATTGCLFAATKLGAQTLAGELDLVAGMDIRAAVDAYLSAELTDTAMITVTQHDEHAAQQPILNWAPTCHPVCFPVLLRGMRQGESLVCGVAVLQLKAAEPEAIDQQVLDAVGQVLLDADDSSGLRQAV